MPPPYDLWRQGHKSRQLVFDAEDALRRGDGLTRDQALALAWKATGIPVAWYGQTTAGGWILTEAWKPFEEVFRRGSAWWNADPDALAGIAHQFAFPGERGAALRLLGLLYENHDVPPRPGDTEAEAERVQAARLHLLNLPEPDSVPA